MARFTAKGFSAALNRLASVPSQIAPPVAIRIDAAIQRQFDQLLNKLRAHPQFVDVVKNDQIETLADWRLPSSR